MNSMKITTLCMSLAFSLGIQDANSAIRVKNLGNENNFVYISPERFCISEQQPDTIRSEGASISWQD